MMPQPLPHRAAPGVSLDIWGMQVWKPGLCREIFAVVERLLRER
jgi:hypothetical protein